MTLPDTFDGFVRLAWKRKFWLLVPLVLGLLVSSVVLRLIPPQYRASTMILVESQRIPTEYVRPTITSRLDERLRSMEQQITNRENLERIIEEMGLYPEERARFGMDRALRLAKKNLQLSVMGASVFRIYFTSGNGVTAADTANRVADMFIQENLKRRTDEARNTSSFLEEELEKVRLQLEDQEQKVTQFGLEHAGRMPGDRQGNLQATSQLQSRLEIILDSIDKAELKKLMLVSEIDQLRRIDPSAEPVEKVGRLQTAKAELLRLQSQYTDQHPDVIRLRREIEGLEQRDDIGVDARQPAQFADDPQLGILMAQFNTQMMDLQRLEEDREKILIGLRRYQTNLEAIPKVEQELIQLTRDYDNLERSYQSLLSKRIEAKLAENLEQKSQGERFTVLERAVPPSRPFAPDRRIFYLLGVVLGGAIGVALSFLREQVDSTFLDTTTLREAFPNVSILGVVHRIDRTADAADGTTRMKETA